MTWVDNVVEPDTRKALWEILVPTVKRITTAKPTDFDISLAALNIDEHITETALAEAKEKLMRKWSIKNSYKLKHHKVWDEYVQSISGGLTIFEPANGRWISASGDLFAERMIPVRIFCTRTQINQIIDFTISHYNQLAVMCYRVSDEVIIRHVCDNGCQYSKDVGMYPEHSCSNECMMEKKNV